MAASNTAYGRPSSVTLAPGEMMVGRRIGGIDAEQKIFNWAEECGHRVVAIGATYHMCAYCQATMYALPYKVDVVTPMRPLQIVGVTEKPVEEFDPNPFEPEDGD